MPFTKRSFSVVGGASGSGGQFIVDYIEAADQTARFALVVPDDIQEGDVVHQLSDDTWWRLIDDANVANVNGWSQRHKDGVVAAASSTDEAVARFDGTGGNTVQNSVVKVNDAGDVTSPTGRLITSPALTANNEFPAFTTKWKEWLNGADDLAYGFHDTNIFGTGTVVYGFAFNRAHLDASPNTDKDMVVAAIEASAVGGPADGGVIGLIGSPASFFFMDDGAGTTEIVVGAAQGDNLSVFRPAADQMILTGGLSLKRVSTATNYTTLIKDSYIGVTDTTSPRTITIIPAATAGVGATQIIKDESGAAGTNAITLDGDGDDIDGSPTLVINADHGVARIISDGANWFTF